MGPQRTLAWWGRKGYRFGAGEQRSSADTTSRECSKASALSTRRAARRGRPSVRWGTCASSPRTSPSTWGTAGGSQVSVSPAPTKRAQLTPTPPLPPAAPGLEGLGGAGPGRKVPAGRGRGLTWSSSLCPRASRAEDRVSAVAWVPTKPASSRQAAVYTARSARAPSSQELQGVWGWGWGAVEPPCLSHALPPSTEPFCPLPALSSVTSPAPQTALRLTCWGAPGAGSWGGGGERGSPPAVGAVAALPGSPAAGSGSGWGRGPGAGGPQGCPRLARIPSARAVRVRAPTGAPRAGPHTPLAMAAAHAELVAPVVGPPRKSCPGLT